MSIDVNEAFRSSKLTQIQQADDKIAALRQQVEAGQLRDNGNGTFTVTAGWDRGETLRQSSSGQILADHGLDTMEDGRAKLYTREQEWHGLGQRVPDGLDDIHEVLGLIGGELEYSKQPAYYQDPMTGEFRLIPDTFAAIWQDPDLKSGAMGAVGNVYTHAQDADAAAFLTDLIGERVVWETVGRMDNNARFFAGLRLREDMVIDPQGIADGIRQYLYFINRHDGKGKLNMIVTPWRIACRNTERFSVRDAVTSWGVRHTTNWNSEERQAEARTALGLTTRYYANWKTEQEELLAAPLTGRGVDSFWEIVEGLDAKGGWAKPEASKKRAGTNYSNRRDRIETLLGENTATLGKNAYAAERAVTQYLDHDMPRRSSSIQARQSGVLLGYEDDKKTRLHEGLLTLVRG